MTEQIPQSVELQKQFFGTHQTKSIDFRIEQLKILKKAIMAYEDRLYEALWADLHKSKFEAYATEIGLVLAEIGGHIRHLRDIIPDRRAKYLPDQINRYLSVLHDIMQDPGSNDLFFTAGFAQDLHHVH